MSRPGTGRFERLAAWPRPPLPPRSPRVSRGPLATDAFPSRLRSTRLSAQLGVALGVAFGICFATGLLSHLIQHPPTWFGWPARPVWLYRVTQGAHVATGVASVPLLGAKLWSVYPRLFRWPPVRDLVHAAERAGIAILVAGALFQLVSGVLNVSLWYSAMPFFFPAAHYWIAWLVMGALLVHVGVQLPATRRALARLRPPAEPVAADPVPAEASPTEASPVKAVPGTMSRRGLLGVVAAASGLVTVTTIGQTLTPLAPVALLAPRRPEIGPQGLPVNKTAAAAGVLDLITQPGYRLVLTGPAGDATLRLADLVALPQHTAALPIACVQGWSATGLWSGVRLRDLVELAGADPTRVAVLVESLQVGGRYRSTVVPPAHVRDPLTLLALRLGDEPLQPDHGYPARLIAPNRPGVLQTKWVGRITVRDAR